ncbi:MAG: RNA polymerase sigma factor [Ignavibacteria bacterium]|nr:RNA polymerase sigma factor [Ignavibacteria bacterium]
MQALRPIQPSLERFALHLTHNRDEARELVADTIASAYERFHTIKDERAFLSFLLTIASRSWKQTVSTRRRQVATEPESFDQIFGTTLQADVHTDVVLLYEAMALLPHDQHQAIVMFEVMGLNVKEIAAAQNSTSVAVKVRLHRARKKLRELLTDPTRNNPTPKVKPIGEVLV